MRNKNSCFDSDRFVVASMMVRDDESSKCICRDFRPFLCEYFVWVRVPVFVWKGTMLHNRMWDVICDNVWSRWWYIPINTSVALINCVVDLDGIGMPILKSQFSIKSHEYEIVSANWCWERYDIDIYFYLLFLFSLQVGFSDGAFSFGGRQRMQGLKSSFALRISWQVSLVDTRFPLFLLSLGWPMV